MGFTGPPPEPFFTTTTTTFEAASASSSSSSSSSSAFSRIISLPTQLVKNPSLKKGDTHHLVSLTSTTYGSPFLLGQPSSDHHQNRNLSLDSEIQENPSPDSFIDDWVLMAGLDDFELSSNPNSTSFFDRSYSARHDSSSFKKPFFSLTGSSKPTRSENSNPDPVREGTVKKFCSSLMKPLWKKHVQEESLLAADMDPNVLSRRSMSSRQLGFNQSKTAKALVGTSSRLSSMFENQIRLPGTEDKIVVYFTSLRGIRRTYEDCSAVRNILRGFRVPVDERDTSMDATYRRELQGVLGDIAVILPHVFIRGRYIGGAEEIKQLHEVGELAKLLEGFPIRDPRYVCDSCGNARFVPCSNCNGSRKVFDEDEGQSHRCPTCNENGLIRCPSCNS